MVAIDFYKSSSRGKIIKTSPSKGARINAISEDQRTFDKKYYSEEVHTPIPVLSTKNYLDKTFKRCLDMPIRLKGMTEYYLPEEWEELSPLIKAIAAIEHKNNPSVIDDYYTYITVDSSIVTEKEQQRRGGLHVDGFQGARISPKTKITRNYVATSNGGTRFYPQLFNANFNESIYNIFEGFDLQAEEPIIAGENTVYFMDAYTVHESGFAAAMGLRTFFRMTYDCKEFDRQGNTHNSLLSYDWPMVERNVQSELLTPTSDILPLPVK